MADDLFARLAAPFPPESISWRVGATNADKTKGIALAYLDARDVMDRLDTVCGPAGWQCKYSHVGQTVVCDIGVWIGGEARKELDTIIFGRPGEWLWKADGAGATDVEAEKGALSDAFKRAAVRWGIGRYLYALPSPWVSLVAAGRSQKISDSEFSKLRDLLRVRAPDGVKRLTSSRAKQIGLDVAIREKIEGCTSLLALSVLDTGFDKLTEEAPLSWLDSIRNQILLRGEELQDVATPAREMRQNARGDLEPIE